MVDTHCHLCPGLDDGPQTEDESLQICQLAWHEGIRVIAALAHQNDAYPDVTPARIKRSVEQLTTQLDRLDIPLQLVPTAEVMICADTMEQWHTGGLLSYGDQGRYILLEYPHGLFLDIRQLAAELVHEGVRPVIAHAERYPELLHDAASVEQLIQVGCLIQVTSRSIVEPNNRQDDRALRNWFRRDLVHVVGTDAHSPRHRRPVMATAFERVSRWTNAALAQRIFHENGLAVLHGKTVGPLRAAPTRRPWSFMSVIR